MAQDKISTAVAQQVALLDPFLLTQRAVLNALAEHLVSTFHQGGRLFLSIRDRQGLVYRISAFSLEGLDPGYFAVYGATSPDKVERLIDSIRAELKRLRTVPVPRAELARADDVLDEA